MDRRNLPTTIFFSVSIFKAPLKKAREFVKCESIFGISKLGLKMKRKPYEEGWGKFKRWEREKVSAFLYYDVIVKDLGILAPNECIYM